MIAFGKDWWKFIGGICIVVLIGGVIKSYVPLNSKHTSSMNKELKVLVEKGKNSKINLKVTIENINNNKMKTLLEVNTAIEDIHKALNWLDTTNIDFDNYVTYVNEHKKEILDEGLDFHIVSCESINPKIELLYRETLRGQLNADLRLLQYLRDNYNDIRQKKAAEFDKFMRLVSISEKARKKHADAFLLKTKYAGKYFKEHPSAFEYYTQAQKILN